MTTDHETERPSGAAAAPEDPVITTFVIDDEALARTQITELASQVPWVRHLGGAADGREGLDAVHALRPDVLFLDIELPELTGIAVAERLAYAPAVIFTTAHDRYAVAAFEVDAVDYLLKPFGRRRFVAALERARRTIAARSPEPVSATGAETRVGLLGDRLLVRDPGAIVPIPLALVERIDAEDDYVAVVSRGRRHLMAARIGDLAAQLPPGRFLRVHRSHVVNLDYVERLVPYDAKRLEVHLRDGTRILASRAASELIRRTAR